MIKGQSVRKTEWKQTDMQIDRDDCITCRANAVGKNSCHTVHNAIESL